MWRKPHSNVLKLETAINQTWSVMTVSSLSDKYSSRFLLPLFLSLCLAVASEDQCKSVFNPLELHFFSEEHFIKSITLVRGSTAPHYVVQRELWEATNLQPSWHSRYKVSDILSSSLLSFTLPLPELRFHIYFFSLFVITLPLTLFMSCSYLSITRKAAKKKIII